MTLHTVACLLGIIRGGTATGPAAGVEPGNQYYKVLKTACPLLRDDDSMLLIPAARHEEQARLEAEAFLGSARSAACPRIRSVSSACARRVTGSPSG
ncbi:hypothetical protein ACIQRC_33125 [Streptomyces californicus]|uniref:hypothetical protein n=1 Tax=Streptomyces californicus TaxID=67351 RepID=UPI00381CD537